MNDPVEDLKTRLEKTRQERLENMAHFRSLGFRDDPTFDLRVCKILDQFASMIWEEGAIWALKAVSSKKRKKP